MTDVIAHRGASHVEVENTVRAFRRAAAFGADAVELDVRRSADGLLVVHHDAVLADGRAICDTDRSSLPSHIPTLGEALDACGSMWVNVEIKNDDNDPDFDPRDTIADDTVAALVARDEDERWVISSFRLATVDRCRALAPSIRTALLTIDVPDGVWRTLVNRGHFALHPWYGSVSAEHIAAAHAAGVKVNVWTCDEPEWMVNLATWGVDGICTNDPDVARRILAAT